MRTWELRKSYFISDQHVLKQGLILFKDIFIVKDITVTIGKWYNIWDDMGVMSFIQTQSSCYSKELVCRVKIKSKRLHTCYLANVPLKVTLL